MEIREGGGSLTLEIWAGGGFWQSGKFSQKGGSKMLAIRRGGGGCIFSGITQCICHQPSPRGDPGQIQLYMGTLGGFERSFYPAGRGNEGGLVSVSLAPWGKQGTS